MSHLIVDISKHKIGLLLSTIFLVFITYYSLNFYFSDKWFYMQQDKVVDGKLPVPYKLQNMIVNKIAEDARGRNFSLKRVGQSDHFDYDYALNYYYLLWRKKNEPVEGANLEYVIYEDTKTLDKNENIIWVSNVAIVKKKK
jgi:hypothetical protein